MWNICLCLLYTSWELVARRRLQEADKFDDIFDQQLKLRAQIAKNAGFEDYRDYAFRRMGRFDYTPQDCAKFHGAVENEIVPAVRELQSQRRAQLKLEKLCPWDLAVDPLNRPPLRPVSYTHLDVYKRQIQQFVHVIATAEPALAPFRPRGFVCAEPAINEFGRIRVGRSVRRIYRCRC